MEEEIIKTMEPIQKRRFGKSHAGLLVSVLSLLSTGAYIAIHSHIAPTGQKSARVQTAAAVETRHDAVPNGTLTIKKVVDGDTIEVNTDTGVEAVRLIGINTPETVDPRRPVQCFGKEASNKAKELMSGGVVQLVRDTTQDDRDKYGRLLRYVFLPDGTFVNKTLIEEGYAYEYTYRIPYQYQKEFKAAQQHAQSEGLGLWNAGTCDGKLKSV